MVAGDVGCYDPANNLGDSVFEERDASLCPAIANAELRLRLRGLLRLRKINGNGLLMFLQNVDAEEAALLQERQEMAPLIHANENQKGIE